MREFDRQTTSESERSILRDLERLRAAALSDSMDRGPLLRAMEDRLPPFPLKVQIQTTTRCNAACLMCPYPEVAGAADFPHERMAEPLYEAILRELSLHPVERLSLFLMNEPLLDPRMVEWVGRARAALPDAVLGLFTNGAALRPTLARELARAGLDELCVSVHGFDADTYQRVMQGLSFQRTDRVLRRVDALLRRGELGRLRLKVVAGDVPEIVRSLEAADPPYRDHVLLKAFSNERSVVDVGESMPGSSRAAFRSSAPPLCQRPLVKLYVLASGDCVLCNVDWKRSVLLGRLEPGRGIGIRQIWNGARYRALRRRHLLNDLGDGLLCGRCDYAAVTDHE